MRAEPERSRTPTSPAPPRLLAAGVVFVALAVYLMRLDTVAGQYVDDAVYVMSAQAIASGLGYHMISAPTPELAALVPAFPPGLPLVLAMVIAVAPTFPGNVIALKLVSVLAMLGVGVLSAIHYRDRSMPPPLAIAVALVVVITPAFVFLVTSTVMSEPLFTLAELAAVVLIGRRRPVLGGLAAAAAALVRSAGLPLLAAGAIYYWIQRDRRSARRFLVTAIAALLPWMVYARAYSAPVDVRHAHGGAFVSTYSEQFWMKRAGDVQSGRMTASDIPARIGASLVDIFGRDTGAIVLPELYRSPTESGMETASVGGRRSDLSQGSMGNTTGTMVVSAIVSVVTLIGFVARWRRGAGVSEWFVPLALVPIVLFPHWAYRLVLPLTPFLYGYLVDGVQAITTSWTRVLRIALSCLTGLHLVDHAMYRVQMDNAVWLAEARESAEVTDFMRRELREPGAVASTNPPLIFLRTGRRGVVSEDARGRWEAWKAMGVRYVVDLAGSEMPDPALGYRLLLETDRSKFWIIEIAD